jgi:PIN domain nuclease of toxin-antitoxin system
VWEAAVKAAAGRLDAPTPILDAAEDAGLGELPVRSRHAVIAAGLPPLHRDPFDRMLVAQALDEDLVLLTRDDQIGQYDVRTIRA